MDQTVVTLSGRSTSGYNIGYNKGYSIGYGVGILEGSAVATYQRHRFNREV